MLPSEKHVGWGSRWHRLRSLTLILKVRKAFFPTAGPALLVFLLSLIVTLKAQETTAGILGTYRQKGGSAAVRDAEVFERMSFYSPVGAALTPFFDFAEFEITWDGNLSVPLRDDYRFRAFVQGDAELSVNGTVVLRAEDGDGWTEASEEVRLRKGENAIQVRFRNDSNRDAVFRLEWASPDFLFEPIHPRHWSYQSTEALRIAQDLRWGRDLFIESRCDACHEFAGEQRGESSIDDTVNLDGIASRRRASWLREWLLDPSAVRQQARMPGIFHGPSAEAEVDAVVAFLVNETEALDSNEPALSDESIERGKELFESLNCIQCHGMTVDERNDGQRVWLGAVAKKFSLNSLSQFLVDPTRHYPAIRMPRFDFDSREAGNLAAFLYSKSEPHAAFDPSFSEKQVEAGRALVLKHGCLNCHAGFREKLELPRGGMKRAIVDPQNGCLAPSNLGEAGLPDFRFDDEQRRVLIALLNSKKGTWRRRVARVEAQRHVKNLRCAACHSELEGVTSFEYLGGKLKSSWLERLFRGEVSVKPRPWLRARMPAFPAYAHELAEGLGHAHGYGRSPLDSEENRQSDLAEIGRQLISPVDGFSCVSCHGVADLKPTQVFESEGINFSFSADRLRKDYYRRWLLNPVRIDPASKMPVYFDEEGYSPLFDVLDGDTDQQLEAIWQYFLLGEEMVPPVLE